jgi:hypothetical protein
LILGYPIDVLAGLLLSIDAPDKLQRFTVLFRWAAIIGAIWGVVWFLFDRNLVAIMPGASIIVLKSAPMVQQGKMMRAFSAAKLTTR